MAIPLQRARIARDSDSSKKELYSVVIHLCPWRTSTMESLKRKFRLLREADIIVCTYYGNTDNYVIPIPPTHRYAASLCYDEQFTVVLSKVRLSSSMLFHVFPKSLFELPIEQKVRDHHDARMLVSSLEYSKPPGFSIPNETDTKRMHELTIGEKKYGAVLSEDYESKYPNGQKKPYLTFDSVYVPPGYASVNLVCISDSCFLVFFRDDGDEYEKFLDSSRVPQKEHSRRLFELLENRDSPEQTADVGKEEDDEEEDEVEDNDTVPAQAVTV